MLDLKYTVDPCLLDFQFNVSDFVTTSIREDQILTGKFKSDRIVDFISFYQSSNIMME